MTIDEARKQMLDEATKSLERMHTLDALKV
jgi:hypothetical protein